VDPSLVFFDVERPVGIEVPAQVNSSELENGLGNGCAVPADDGLRLDHYQDIGPAGPAAEGGPEESVQPI
jgi:hypothetical protein